MPAQADIYGGREPRDLALYSLRVAASIVRVPAGTLRAWTLGRTYSTRSGERHWPALIKAADRSAGRLSFTNIVELHVLSALRGKQVRVDRIRSATKFIRDNMEAEHPLADVDTHTDCIDVYVEYLGRLTNASSARTDLRPIIERYLERIDRDQTGLARRLFPVTRDLEIVSPRLVVIDPARRFGRPVLAGGNVETAVIADRLWAGDSTSDLVGDYGIATDAVEEAVRFENYLRAA